MKLLIMIRNLIYLRLISSKLKPCQLDFLLSRRKEIDNAITYNCKEGRCICVDGDTITHYGLVTLDIKALKSLIASGTCNQCTNSCQLY